MILVINLRKKIVYFSFYVNLKIIRFFCRTQHTNQCHFILHIDSYIFLKHRFTEIRWLAMRREYHVSCPEIRISFGFWSSLHPLESEQENALRALLT